MRLTRLIFILALTFYLRAHSPDLISKKKKLLFSWPRVCVCVCVCSAVPHRQEKDHEMDSLPKQSHRTRRFYRSDGALCRHWVRTKAFFDFINMRFIRSSGSGNLCMRSRFGAANYAYPFARVCTHIRSIQLTMNC